MLENYEDHNIEDDCSLSETSSVGINKEKNYTDTTTATTTTIQNNIMLSTVKKKKEYNKQNKDQWISDKDSFNDDQNSNYSRLAKRKL